MSTRNKTGSVMGGAAVIAAVVGLTAGLAPAAAAPPQSGAFLAVGDDAANPLTYRLVVIGTFPMQQADAVGFINNINTGKQPGGIDYYIYADDSGPVRGPNWNTTLFYRFYPGAGSDPDGYLRATSEGLTYQRYISVPRGDLNEDGDGEDEIFARVIFRDADGVARTQYSQKVVRSF
jgi:hypothetical protein